MTENVENLMLEHLKKIQAEQTAARERDQEIITRLSHIESGLARITRDESANYAEMVEDRSSLYRQAARTTGTHRATFGN